MAQEFEKKTKDVRNPAEAAGIFVSGWTSKGPEASLAVSPYSFSDLMNRLYSGSITSLQAKEVYEEMLSQRKTADEIIKSKNLSAVADEATVGKALDRVIAARPELLAQARADQKAFSYLIGQVLKEEPSAEPRVVAKLVSQRVRGE